MPIEHHFYHKKNELSGKIDLFWLFIFTSFSLLYDNNYPPPPPYLHEVSLLASK